MIYIANMFMSFARGILGISFKKTLLWQYNITKAFKISISLLNFTGNLNPLSLTTLTFSIVIFFFNYGTNIHIKIIRFTFLTKFNSNIFVLLDLND